MSRVRLVVFAHGSRDPRWREPFARLRDAIAARIGDESVRLAYMEFADPTLMAIAEDAVRDGVGGIRILPLFLAGGAHVANDIPAQVSEIRTRHPGLRVDILPPVGEDPRLVALLRTIAFEAAEGAGEADA